MKWRWLTFLLALTLVTAGAPRAPAQPATAPADQADGGGGRDGARFLERVLDALDDLKLTDEQRGDVRKIVDDARAEIRAAVQDMQGADARQRAERIREQLERLREQLGAVLDEQQRETLRRHIEEARRFAPGRDARADNPATAPADAPSGPEGRVAALAQRFRDAIEQLKLSDETQAEAMKVADELRAKVRRAAADGQGDVEQLRAKVRELVNDARLDLQEILTPEQQERLRELLEPARREMRRERVDRPARPTAPEQPAEPMTPETPAAPATAPSGPGNEGPRALAPPPPNLRPGQPAADFALDKLDGRPAQLSSFKGKPLVLLFGNYSSPGFRDRADDYEQLRKQFANRAEFLIVYTRESHPVGEGEWEVERNKHAHVLVEQPKTFEERKALARQAKQALRITIPIAIDTMDDKTAKEYGGFTTSAIIIGRDGTIVGSRTYADAHSVKRILESVIAGKPTTSPS